MANVLKNYFIYDKVREMNFSGALVERTKKTSDKIVGIYWKEDNCDIGIFLLDEVVRFYVNSFSLIVSEDTQIKITALNENNYLLASNNDQYFFKKPEYQPKKFKNDPTPFICEEDFNIILFLQDVINDKNRLKLLVDSWR